MRLSERADEEKWIRYARNVNRAIGIHLPHSAYLLQRCLRRYASRTELIISIAFKLTLFLVILSSKIFSFAKRWHIFPVRGTPGYREGFMRKNEIGGPRNCIKVATGFYRSTPFHPPSIPLSLPDPLEDICQGRVQPHNL